MLKPIKRQNLSDQVFHQLRSDILNQTYLPGERLPSERELCDILKINRSSVREALKRLEQARLIEIRQGRGAVVLDFRYSSGFELLGHLLSQTDKLNFLTARSIAEFRELLCGEAARLAAFRIQNEELACLEAIVLQIESCNPADLEQMQRLDWEFIYTIVRASENLAFLLLFNSVKDAYFELRNFFACMFTATVGDRGAYRSILNALGISDGETACRLCRGLIEKGNRCFLQAYSEAGNAN
jgi:GntR family transcriptional regulator, transcriptional repressor for pyruvate dehydrogenase complex